MNTWSLGTIAIMTHDIHKAELKMCKRKSNNVVFLLLKFYLEKKINEKDKSFPTIVKTTMFLRILSGQTMYSSIQVLMQM